MSGTSSTPQIDRESILRDLERSELSQVLELATSAVDQVRPIFTQYSGNDPEIFMKLGDFATEADFLIEKKLREILIAGSGLPVYGEEYGTWNPLEDPDNSADPMGNHPDSKKLDPNSTYRKQNEQLPELCWVVDPIDGTANYAVTNPMCCIMVSLVYKGSAIVAVVDMPKLNHRFTATRGGGLFHNGVECSRLEEFPKELIQISFGSILSQRRGNLPITYRQDMLNAIGQSYPRMRVTGSVGIDLAFTAGGIFGGSVTFSPNIWDNCAGILMVEEAGGKASDFAGNPWRSGVSGLVVGSPEIHTTLLEHIQSVHIDTAAKNAQEIMDRGGIS